ncbi:M48 family metalloprotease [Azospirillum sp. ST 5-10]|uniref:M48 family metallopeptidase n=1 Tax=unclassified Azospirillum TaxID=2630922 RepID=UPI003F4A5B5C
MPVNVMPVNAMRRAAALVVALLALAACQTAGTGADRPERATFEPGRSILSQLPAGGATAAAQATPVSFSAHLQQRLAGNGTFQAPAWEDYANRVLAKLQAHAPPVATPLRVYLRPDRDLQAMAHPDGSIAVSLGLIDALESEDELAAVLAHELAHFVLGHHDKTVLQRLYNQASTGLSVYLRLRAGNEDDAQVRGMLLSMAVLEAGRTGLFPAWSRGDEETADLLGIDIAVAANYSKLGMLKYMEKVEAYEAQLITQRQADQRRLDELDDRKMREAGPDYRALIETVSNVMRRKLNDALEALREGHETAKLRIAAIKEYNANVHAGVPNRRLQTAPWTAARGHRQAKPHLDSVRDSLRALEHLAENDVPAARRVLRSSAIARGPGLAFTDYAQAVVAKTAGDTRTAEGMFRSAIDRRDASISAYQELAGLFLVTGDARQALDVTNRANEELGKPEQLLPDFIRASTALGNQLEALGYRGSCLVSGNVELVPYCEAASTGAGG